jgi:nucleoid DNA-binding protein
MRREPVNQPGHDRQTAQRIKLTGGAMVATDYKLRAIKEKQTKDQLVTSIAEDTEIPNKQVRAVLQSLAEHARRHLVEQGSGEFVVPDLGIKLKRARRGASKDRMGHNPGTGEPMLIPGKPERNVVRATIMKALNEVVEGMGPPPARETVAVAGSVEAVAAPRAPSSVDLLIGKWQSDAEATQRDADKSPALTAEQKKSLGNVFGKLVATYTRASFTTEYNGKVTTYEYKATGSGSNYVDIDFFNPEKSATERKRIFVQGNMLWIELPELGFREIFRRIS